jgi:hypothetical protein
MNVDSLRRFCLSFPHTKDNLQWGETLCFKVRGKLFALVSLDAVPPTLCFKVTPERFAEFGFVKVRYRGLKKNAHRLFVTCVAGESVCEPQETAAGGVGSVPLGMAHRRSRGGTRQIPSPRVVPVAAFPELLRYLI